MTMLLYKPIRSTVYKNNKVMSGSDDGVSGGSSDGLEEGDQAPKTVYQQETLVETESTKKPGEEQQKVDKILKEVIEAILERYDTKREGLLEKQFIEPYFVEVCQALSLKIPEDPGIFAETAKKLDLL